MIILNWRRPQNIGRIVEAAAKALPDGQVFVLDQADPLNSLAGREDVPWDLFWRRTRRNTGAAARMALAAALPFERYLCIDDDTFLTEPQIRALVFMLNKEPGRAHGIRGQLATITADGKHLLNDNITRSNRTVSVLNQVYAFSRTQAEEALVLASLVGFKSWEDVRFGDDMLLSCAGNRPPRLHDLGPLEICPSADAPGIAAWTLSEFDDRRLDLASKLFRLGRLYVEKAPSKPQ